PPPPPRAFFFHQTPASAIGVRLVGAERGTRDREDLIETMLGYEIVDEKDTITDLQAYARRKSSEKQDKTDDRDQR
ncbi:MAG: hypothetical protein K2L79_00250, partial [Bacteroidales bacterium]|nr:hypothetical protein [Bacteroidales bacterium]